MEVLDWRCPACLPSAVQNPGLRRPTGWSQCPGERGEKGSCGIVTGERSVRHAVENTAARYLSVTERLTPVRVQELCESRGGRPGLSVLMSLTVSVDVKQH